MARCVLDSSVIMMAVNEEPGFAELEPWFVSAACSANIVAEVATRLFERGVATADVRAAISAFDLAVYDVDFELALVIGELRPLTKVAGLSMGDRTCLALAKRLGVPAITADRSWARVADAVGVDVRVVR